MKTPLTLITGYLGSGKTTLLRHILKNTKEKLALIVNEFGELGIDGKVLKGKNVKMTELAGGCVCCSLTGEFEAAVQEVLKKVKPDAIVVETTGLAEPDALAGDIEENLPQIRLDGVVTILDADALVRFPALGHTGRIQIEMADLLLLNKCDLVEAEKLPRIEARLRTLNPQAPLLRATHCAISLDYLFGIHQEKKIRPHAPHDPSVSFFTYSTKNPVKEDAFLRLADALPPEVYRAKGFIRFQKGSALFNFVAGRYSLEKFSSSRTELIFLGEKVQAVAGTLKKKLRSLEQAP